MNLFLETNRVHLRQFILEDAVFIQQLLNTDDWLNFIGDREIYNQEAAAHYIETKLMLGYMQSGYGFHAMIEKSTNETIGMAGIFKRDYLEFADLGYAILPQYYRRGYTFEICEALIGFATNELKLSKLSAIVTPDHHASKNLLKKLNFHLRQTIIKEGEALEEYVRAL